MFRVLEPLEQTVIAVVWSRSLSFEGDSDSGPYLFHLDGLLCNFVAAYLLSCNLFCNKNCFYTIVHLSLEEFKHFSQVILKYTIIMSHTKS